MLLPSSFPHSSFLVWRSPATAFSLLEVVMVVALIAIVASIGIGRYAGSAGHHSLEGAARRVIADLELARQKAVALSRSQTVTFSRQTSSYTLDGMGGLNDSGQTYVVDLKLVPYETSIRTVDVDGAGGSILRFDAFGRPVISGTVTTPNPELNIVLGGGSRTVKITVDSSTGRAYVGTP